MSRGADMDLRRRTFGRWMAGGGLAGLGAAAAGCGGPRARVLAGSAPTPEPVAGQAATLSAQRLPSGATGQPPEPGPAVAPHVPVRSEEALGEHGLRLIVAPRPGLPLVSVALLLRCGPAFDPPGRRGTAELMAQSFTRGALRQGRAFDGVALARQAEALGGTVSVRVEERLIALEMTVLTPRAAAALALLADLLRQPLFVPADLLASRAQARDALSLRLQDPAQLVTLVARRIAWGGDPQARVTTPSSLSAVRREDVVALHRRWVRPDRVAVVLAGDVDLARARALAGPVLGDWARPSVALEADPDEPLPLAPGGLAAPLLPSTLLLHLPAAAQASVLVCAPFVGTAAPDHPAGTLAAAVVGAGHSARLNQEVRIRRGLSYGVAGWVEQQRLGGLFLASAQTEPAHASEVAVLMRQQLLALAQQAPGPAELEARRAALLGGLARQLDTTSGLVARIGTDWALGATPDGLARWPAQLAAVRPAQVQAFAERHWGAPRLRTIVAGPVDALRVDPAAPDAPLRLDARQLDLDRPGLRR